MTAEKRWLLPGQDYPSDQESDAQAWHPDQAFTAAIGGHPIVAQTLYQRGYSTLESAQAFLDPDLYQPASPFDLPDLSLACDLLLEAIHENAHILVWGDFDVDGQTATSLLVEGLRKVGAAVSYHIPVRAHESHGINRATLTEKLKQTTLQGTGFDLLLTCDTGISEHENVQILRNLGKPVIITDHHSLNKTLPHANAVINPQRLPPDHPLRFLPGVGVAFKLIEGVYTRYFQEQLILEKLDFNRLLELVALGIVSDVAELRGDNRYLLQMGLSYLRTTQRVGLQMLFQLANIDPSNLNEGHIGFQIAPRLNAVGRLGDANPMVTFLTTQDKALAREIAYQIEAMNARRRNETHLIEKAAESQLSASSDDRHAPAIVLHHPKWPGGVVGIVANHLVERYNKPALLLTGDDPITGSARSIPGLNITEAIAEQADLLEHFGGHPMAAGLALSSNHFTAFKRRFLSSIVKRMKDLQIVQTYHLAQVLTLDQVNEAFISQIERLAPFGPGNPPLLFLVEGLTLISETRVGATQEHRQVSVADSRGNQLRLIWWNSGDEPLIDDLYEPEITFDLVCKLTLTDYKGKSQVGAEWIDYRLSEAGLQKATARHVEIVDCRTCPNPIAQIQSCLESDPNTVIWCEGIYPDAFPTQVASLVKTRHTIEPVDHLVIFTAPPSSAVFHQTIQRSKPKKVTVFALNSGVDEVNGFLKRLIGLAKFAVVNMDGIASLERLAAGCAAEEASVITGLHILEARRLYAVEWLDTSVRLNPKPSKQDDEPNEQAQLRAEFEGILAIQLEESRAFRDFFQKADLQAVLAMGKTKKVLQ